MTTTNQTSKYIKPLIKWVGGKTQIIDHILDTFPKDINNYHELFLGGGSVLLALLEDIKNNKIKLKGKVYAYDFNETLIYMYKNIQTCDDNLLKEIQKLIDDYNNIKPQNPISTEENEKDKKNDEDEDDEEETEQKKKKEKEVKTKKRNPKTLDEAKESQESYYYWIRSSFNKMKQSEKNSNLGTAYFIFLNKTCFRGLYREGPNGFNVPFGNYKNPEIVNMDHLKEISSLINNVIFTHSSFEESFKKVSNDDFVYLDPPYAPENDKSFVSYTASGFTEEQHKLLFKTAKKYKFVMSNSDVDMVKDEFKDNKKFTIKIISCKRSINSKKPNSKTNEVIIQSI
jgi:DNA adenine methylase